jgi:hypothetical protein
MGLSNNFVADLVELKQRHALDGISRVIEIGAQQLSNALLRAKDTTEELYRLYGLPPKKLGDTNFQGMVK